MSWTQEKEEKLRQLWEKGHTASQIAEILGDTTRNAVIGKAHRLKLAARAPNKKSVAQKKEVSNVQNRNDKQISRKSRFKSILLDKNFEPAKNLELDLVEISPKALPPVCKAMEYKKFLYEQKKRDKLIKSKSTKVIVKELRFGPNTDEHDYEFKKKHGIKFLKEGAKLKAFVFFKGRSIIFKEKGQILLLRLAQELEEYGKVESLPTMEGKKMIMFVAPKK